MYRAQYYMVAPQNFYVGFVFSLRISPNKGAWTTWFEKFNSQLSTLSTINSKFVQPTSQGYAKLSSDYYLWQT